MNVLAREARETGRDYALRVLTHNIIHLGLAPGQKMSENELAAQLGLSRTPVREALMALAKVRLVQVHPQRCSTVSLIDYNLVEEARFLRGVLECAVAELACAQASPGEVQELTQKQYDLGAEDYFAVSDAQRIALENERLQLSTLGDKYRACVNLIGALGGGWTHSASPSPEDMKADMYSPIRQFDK